MSSIEKKKESKKRKCWGDSAFRDDPKMILQRLKDGNKRFMTNNLERPNQSRQRRICTDKNGQRPYAIVLSCADSRVSPELIFDTGIADLFVLRVAGNIANSGSIGSIEFAVSALKCQFILVLGHEDCGAVNAAITTKKNSDKETDLQKLVGEIRGNVKKCQCKHKTSVTKDKDIIDKYFQHERLSENGKETACLEKATIENVISVRKTLLKNKTIKKHKVKIHTGYYKLASGKVVFDPPSEC